MEQEQDIIELLKPRYKVIATMPVLPFEVGEIYDADFIQKTVLGKHFYVRLDIYPHLFKKLEWWEERNESDMPEYVKHSFNGKAWVYKIQFWNMKQLNGYISDREVASLGTMKPEYDLKPATKEEYLNQNK